MIVIKFGEWDYYSYEFFRYDRVWWFSRWNPFSRLVRSGWTPLCHIKWLRWGHIDERIAFQIEQRIRRLYKRVRRLMRWGQ